MSSSRPETPNLHKRRLLRSSGIHLIQQSPKVHYPVDENNLPLESHINIEKFARLSDSIEELEVNMTNLQHIHEVLSSKFNESFASFLYGLSITMWCVDFPGCPTKAVWERLVEKKAAQERARILQEKIAQAKEENEQLKLKLESISQKSSDDITARPRKSFILLTFRERPSRPFRQPAPVRKPEPQDDDETNSNNSSFVLNPAKSTSNNRLSRIPQPQNRKTDLHSTPNLNQPPRYMHGLYNRGQLEQRRPFKNNNLSAYGVNKTPTLRPARVSKLADRPPFR